MKYFLDQEFHSHFIEPLFTAKSRHVIDLISIGIVDENGREYYAISKEFDLKNAWKDDWLRENVLESIYNELYTKQSTDIKTHHYSLIAPFSLKTLGNLINWHGKTEKQIAAEVVEFCTKPRISSEVPGQHTIISPGKPTFYGYYADYDWVLFCSLFGRMIDLPEGFPMYCRDLKQMYDEKEEMIKASGSLLQRELKTYRSYPKQENEHNALSDAKWNRKLFNFLEDIY